MPGCGNGEELDACSQEKRPTEQWVPWGAEAMLCTELPCWSCALIVALLRFSSVAGRQDSTIDETSCFCLTRSRLGISDWVWHGKKKGLWQLSGLFSFTSLHLGAALVAF